MQLKFACEWVCRIYICYQLFQTRCLPHGPCLCLRGTSTARNSSSLKGARSCSSPPTWTRWPPSSTNWAQRPGPTANFTSLVDPRPTTQAPPTSSPPMCLTRVLTATLMWTTTVVSTMTEPSWLVTLPNLCKLNYSIELCVDHIIEKFSA